MKRIITIVLFVSANIILLNGQDWVVPENRRTRLSPFEFSDESRKEGETSYNTNCMSCHGNPGRNNVINLVPPPPDMATAQAQKNSDGELYFKISEGRGQMPSFRNVLQSKEMWNIISYIRSFNKEYRQSVMPVITSSAYPGAEILLSLNHNPEENIIRVKASAVSETASVPVTNAGVKLFIFRTFGQIPLGDELLTDVNGTAEFKIPSGIPGDTAGNLRISARFSDEEAFGDAGRDTILKAGIPLIPVSLVAERAMWNKASMAPLWVIISFLGGLGTVWLFILFIMLNLRDISVTGAALEKQEESDSKAI